MFMMETFKVIRKEKDANEEERKRRVAWEEAHEERQSRSEAELMAQQKNLDAMSERLAKREEEQAKRDEEQASRDDELAKKEEQLARREEELKQEKVEVNERLKDVENKMAEMREMIEAIRVAAVAPPPPNPVVQPSPLPAVVPPVLLPVPVAVADQPTSDRSSFPDNEENFIENSSRLQLDSPEPFVMSPDLDPVDEESDLPPVSSISAPRSQEIGQSVASTSSSQPSHSSMAAPTMYYFPMPPPHMHAHTHAPTPSTYHFPTPAPYYPYHSLVAPSYDTSSTSQISEFSHQSAAAHYITPNLTPDLAPASVVRPPPPQEPLLQGLDVTQRKRKSKSKHQKKKKKKRKRQATDDNSDSDTESGSESASEGEESSSEETEIDAEPRRRPKRVNGHDKKIYTLPVSI
jgi:hypothetical protein